MSALYTKINPKGIDISIQDLQEYLFNKLSSTWSISDYNSYGRCYKNITNEDGRFVPEIFNGTEYITLFDVDRIDAFSFFVLNDIINYVNHQYKATIDIIFFCNLKKLKNNIIHRADEEVRIDVLNTLEDKAYMYKIQSLGIGTKNVFSEFDEDKIKDNDLQPFHCFKIVGEIEYSINKKCE